MHIRMYLEAGVKAAADDMAPFVVSTHQIESSPKIVTEQPPRSERNITQQRYRSISIERGGE